MVSRASAWPSATRQLQRLALEQLQPGMLQQGHRLGQRPGDLQGDLGIAGIGIEVEEAHQPRRAAPSGLRAPSPIQLAAAAGAEGDLLQGEFRRCRINADGRREPGAANAPWHRLASAVPVRAVMRRPLRLAGRGLRLDPPLAVADGRRR